MDQDETLSCTYCSKDESPFQCAACKSRYCSRKCQELSWPSHRKVCQKIGKFSPNHKCENCTTIHLKVRKNKTEIQCCPKMAWESLEHKIARTTRTEKKSMKVILNGKVVTAENYIEMLEKRKGDQSEAKGMVLGIETLEKGDLREEDITHLMGITGVSRNSAIKSLQENKSPVDALINLTGSK